MSNDSFDNSTITYEDLILLDTNTRKIFLGVFIVITIFSLTGNCAAIYAITRKNYRIFQKTCITSLALSDIFGTLAIAITNMNAFVHEARIWPLGSFWCQFLPMCQMGCVMASSVALMFVAMDRYRNVVFATSKRWNPQLWVCLLVTAALWLGSFWASYPLYTYYLAESVPGENEIFSVCILATDKRIFRNYYIIMVCVIFLPLFVVFLWFYYKIAALVWKHRKPVSSALKKETHSNNHESSSSTTEVKKSQEEIRVERKIRTFKIIITLMVVFIVCRLPYFAIQILKSTRTSFNDMKASWYCIFAFMALHIVNCALNPLLYTFLNTTLKVWLKIRSFFWEICCFCCSAEEFDTFDKNNPFTMEEYAKKEDGKNKNMKVRFRF
ncbi:QRFP-like peptide receptor [Tribolium castaneum]|uniref:Neuropeptide Y receptor-like Protein n=1 Tax=Tribolium castaneum TaxID=7070 RepID=D6WX43_TRICA|nr:PREDICTED: neuropeptide Y receptor [Tribolium castaneum]EFA08047.1 Neuropeptide Y receptor-like Protein [Tribolium castaneum]|eukprot:XP_971107.1 PREDICTED: neuropeptide Y receptor [Tribolium castaneum]